MAHQGKDKFVSTPDKKKNYAELSKKMATKLAFKNLKT